MVVPGVRLLNLKFGTDLFYQLGLKLPSLIRVKLTWRTKPAEELVHKYFLDDGGILIWNGICLHPLGEIVTHHEDLLALSGNGPTLSIATSSRGYST